jgi:hypothetical protein
MSLRPRLEALPFQATGVTTTSVVAAAVAGQRVGLYRLIIQATVAGNFQIQDTAAGALSPVFALSLNQILVLDNPINLEPWWQSGSGLGLQVAVTGGGTMSINGWFLQGP